jgi:hypothetical protein
MTPERGWCGWDVDSEVTTPARGRFCLHLAQPAFDLPVQGKRAGRGSLRAWLPHRHPCCATAGHLRFFVPYRPIGRPTAVNVTVGHAPNKIHLQAATTVSHGIRLKEPGLGDVPVVRADRDLRLEQSSRLGATAPPMWPARALRGAKRRSI